MAGAIRTDGATVAAKLLLDAVSQERPPVSACTTRNRRARNRRATSNYLSPRPVSAVFRWHPIVGHGADIGPISMGIRNEETTAWRRGGAPPIDDLRVPTAGE